MNKQLRTMLTVTVGAVAIVAMMVAGALYLPTLTAQAQDAASVPPPGTALAIPITPRTITVVGEGKVRVEPDIARINIGVETLAPDVREATDVNNEQTDAVLAALMEAGIAKEDMQTSGFNVYAERFGPAGPLPEDQVNYRVSNAVNVIVRDLSTISAVLDAAINAGANNIYGIEFALDDTTAVESEARAAAVEDANARAEELAGLTGVTLGEVVAVSEVVGAQPYFNAFRATAQGLGGGGGPTIQPGQLSLTTQLQVVYEIVSATE